MKTFLDSDFLLASQAAKVLYHDYAEKMPIVDYHCHINPADIADDKRYSSITEVWLGGDHYKWRAMRCNGIPERRITGTKDIDPYDTFLAWAETLPRCVGNPLYHWTYLELKKYFGITEALTPANCADLYARCNRRLTDPDMTVRGIIAQSNVRLICTTDDPVDDLADHARIAVDPTCTVKVLPAFRPDKAMNIDKPGFADYLTRLAAIVGYEINCFADLRRALLARMDYFQSRGCCVSDHALDHPVYAPATHAELDAILSQGKQGPVYGKQAEQFKTAVLLALSEQYHAYGWVMQLHYGCIRNNSSKMFAALGPDTGFDSVSDAGGAQALANLLNAMERGGHLPKMVLYSLNQYDNETIASIAGCFQTDGGCAARIQLGAAWWFNDHKSGMEKQLTDLANLGVLGSFIGMLTDSRSFLSYTRHEYFRRILCNLIGTWVENGEVHADMAVLGQLVQDICYNNAVKFFGFEV
ncbi:MAG: glucuronate isomerase [Lawsonibacter sp.]|nr:glucuronate isomerase [Lawsonibacter sp.]